MKLSFKLAAVIGAALGASLLPSVAQAAENLTLINGALHKSITMAELNMLVDEGVSKGNLHLVLSESNTEPEAARAFLTQTISYDVADADALFASAEGQEMIAQLSKVIMPRSTEEDAEQALRASVINSLADDNRLTPMEIVANYPVDAQVDLIELRRRNSTYAGIDELVAMLESSQAKSKAKMANEELAVRFAQTEARMQDRYAAMWSDSDSARPVALESTSLRVEPIEGLW